MEIGDENIGSDYNEMGMDDEKMMDAEGEEGDDAEVPAADEGE